MTRIAKRIRLIPQCGNFHGTEHLLEPDGFFPTGLDDILDPTSRGLSERRDAGQYEVIARRAEGKSVNEIRTALLLLGPQLEGQYPEIGEGYRFAAYPEQQARPTLSTASGTLAASLVFLGLGLLVLLTSCVNVTNLALARASTRQTEFVVRQALGASRNRVVRQQLTENVLLALSGLVGAWALARSAVGWFVALPFSMDFPIRLDLAPDLRVFGMAVMRDFAGAERLGGFYSKIKGTLDAYEVGLCLWSDPHQKFEPLRVVWEKKANQPKPAAVPDGQAVMWHEAVGRLFHVQCESIDHASEVAVKHQRWNGHDKTESGVVKRNRNTVSQQRRVAAGGRL